MKAISPEQKASYQRDGFLFPVPALTGDEVEKARQGLSRLEDRLQSPLTKADNLWRSSTYTLMPWANALVRHPRILDAVEDLIGPDILVYMSTFFIKEPGTPSFAAWHQDATYFGLSPYEHVTAWVALSDASSLAGCMDVVSFRGEPRQMHHAALRLKDSINGAGQSIVEKVDETGITAMQLKAGQFSLHHTLAPHRSSPNKSQHRRIGLGISYIPSHVKSVGSHRMPAMLVRGKEYGNFVPVPDPVADFDAKALQTHKWVYECYRKVYYEQAEAHEREFGPAPATLGIQQTKTA